MMNQKTDAELARTELELNAVSSAYADIRYLGYRPGQDTWSSYCQAVNFKLADAIKRGEFWAANPDHRLG